MLQGNLNLALEVLNEALSLIGPNESSGEIPSLAIF